ncbi:MAG: hypothetical protein AABX17_03210 [Nanoarchaeota archaeon]
MEEKSKIGFWKVILIIVSFILLLPVVLLSGCVIIMAAGVTIQFLTYYSIMIIPLAIVFIVIIIKIFKRDKSQQIANNPTVNRSLGAKIFMIITVIVGLIFLWFGSCFGVGLITMNPLIGVIFASFLVLFLFIKFINKLNNGDNVSKSEEKQTSLA